MAKAIADTSAPASKGGLDDIDESAGAFDDGERVSGGFDGPSWMPQLVEFSDKVIQQKLAKANPGSSARVTITGALTVAYAWGRKLYFVDIVLKDKSTTRVHAPEHASLYGCLNSIEIGARVKLTYAGRGKAKAGHAAPVLYEVIAERGKSLPEPRKDALVILKRDEKAAAATTTEPIASESDDVEFP